MARKGVQKDSIDIPIGVTVTTGEAARILGVSQSTFRRRASDWGLNPLWDKRGRRYQVFELMKLKKEPLDHKNIASITQPLSSIERYKKLGFRFRIYGSGNRKGYLGFYACQDWREVERWLSRNYGKGTYYLKLLDDNNTMTEHNFVTTVDDPKDDNGVKEMVLIRGKRDIQKSLSRQFRDLKKLQKGRQGNDRE